MKIKRLMASLLCGAVGAATLGLSGCGNAADSGMMDASFTPAALNTRPTAISDTTRKPMSLENSRLKPR